MASDLTMDATKEHGSSQDAEINVLPSDTRIMDRGRTAWCTVAGAWLTMVAVFGYISAFGVYQSFYTQTTSHSSSQISWIGSTQLFLMCFCGIGAGKLMEAGLFRPMICAASVLYVFSLFMLSLADPRKYYQIFLSQGIGMGLGAGFLYSPVLAVQAHHWRTRRAQAMGIVITGSSTGGIFFPIMLNRLLPSSPETSIGFGWAVRASAFVVLALLVCANVLMRANPIPRGEHDVKPDMRSIVSDGPFLVGTAGVVLVICGLFFPYFYLQVYALLHGTNSSLAFYLLTILNASSIPGRIIPNLLADALGATNCIAPATLACAALIFALFGIKSTAGVVVFAVLYGFFSGAYFSLTAPTVASMSPDEKSIGLRVGFAFTFVSFGMLIGTPISGALLGPTFDWGKAAVFSGTFTLCGSALLFVARHLVAKRKGTPFV